MIGAVNSLDAPPRSCSRVEMEAEREHYIQYSMKTEAEREHNTQYNTPHVIQRIKHDIYTHTYAYTHIHTHATNLQRKKQ